MISDRRDKVAGSRWYTANEIANRVKVSVRSVRRWIDQGDLRVHRFGRAVRVSSEDLEAFERQSRQ
jgi:excisionase family DNA binding protein